VCKVAQGITNVIFVTAADRLLRLRQYAIAMKKSGTKARPGASASCAARALCAWLVPSWAWVAEPARRVKKSRPCAAHQLSIGWFARLLLQDDGVCAASQRGSFSLIGAVILLGVAATHACALHTLSPSANMQKPPACCCGAARSLAWS